MNTKERNISIIYTSSVWQSGGWIINKYKEGVPRGCQGVSRGSQEVPRGIPEGPRGVQGVSGAGTDPSKPLGHNGRGSLQMHFSTYLQQLFWERTGKQVAR